MFRLHIGSRIIKTALSIFITAMVCELLDWPPVFAVITAIVTVEPTVADSIRKGIVRFPASAIGSFFAVIFIDLFGNSPITYMLAGTLTIITCFKLRLHAGLLVATITSVAMVEVIQDHYFLSFLIRLGTTTVGLTVSTIVNLAVFPPNYKGKIESSFQKVQMQLGETVQLVFQRILMKSVEDETIHQKMENLNQAFVKLETFVRFQLEEMKYHPLWAHKKNKYAVSETKLKPLRLIHYHLENLVNTPLHAVPWNEKEREHLMHVVEHLGESLKSGEFNEQKHQQQFSQMMALFWEDNEEITKNHDKHPTNFPPELIILYELLSIEGLVKDYFQNVE